MRFDHDENAQLELIARRKVDFEREARAKMQRRQCPPCTGNCNQGRLCDGRYMPVTSAPAFTRERWAAARDARIAVAVVVAIVVAVLAWPL